jgi:hypothetical protein
MDKEIENVNIQFLESELPNGVKELPFTGEEINGLTIAVNKRVNEIEYLKQTILKYGGQINVSKSSNGYNINYLPIPRYGHQFPDLLNLEI